MRMLNIGFNNYVPKDKIVSIVDYNSAPIRRMIAEAKDRGMVINACYGRPTSSVIFTVSNYIIISSVERKTLGKRAEEYE